MRRIYTGYFSRIQLYQKHDLQPISIAQFNPNWYNGVSFPELAPSQELLGAYKYNGLTQTEYEERYTKELRRPEAIRSIEKLKQRALESERDIVLLCYEIPGEFCHRHILAKLLNNLYPQVFHIEEFVK